MNFFLSKRALYKRRFIPSLYLTIFPHICLASLLVLYITKPLVFFRYSLQLYMLSQCPCYSVAANPPQNHLPHCFLQLFPHNSLLIPSQFFPSETPFIYYCLTNLSFSLQIQFYFLNNYWPMCLMNAMKNEFLKIIRLKIIEMINFKMIEDNMIESNK